MGAALDGRTVLVTGGSRGIGRATAVAFAMQRARVFLTYRSDAAAATSTADVIREAGGEASVLAMDLASPESIRHVADHVLEATGAIDVLVNNAVSWGLRPPAASPSFDRLAPIEWRSGLRANVAGACAMMAGGPAVDA